MQEWFLRVVGGLSIGSIILYLITWWRFYKNDRARAKSTEAVSSKTLAESYEIKANTEIQIALEWQKIANGFKDQIQQEREDCARDLEKQREHFEYKIQKLEQKVIFLEDALKHI